MDTFAARLNRTLEAKGLTQDALARQLGLRQQTVSEWCRGKGPRKATQDRVAALLGMGIEAAHTDDIATALKDLSPDRAEWYKAKILAEDAQHRLAAIESKLGILSDRQTSPKITPKKARHSK